MDLDAELAELARDLVVERARLRVPAESPSPPGKAAPAPDPQEDVIRPHPGGALDFD
jgi:hypothetical protein